MKKNRWDLIRSLQIKILKRKNKFNRLKNSILEVLQVNDSDARFLEIEELVASREIVNELWEMLPDESEAYKFFSFNEQKNIGLKFIEKKQNDEKVLIHFA